MTSGPHRAYQGLPGSALDVREAAHPPFEVPLEERRDQATALSLMHRLGCVCLSPIAGEQSDEQGDGLG